MRENTLEVFGELCRYCKQHCPRVLVNIGGGGKNFGITNWDLYDNAGNLCKEVAEREGCLATCGDSWWSHVELCGGCHSTNSPLNKDLFHRLHMWGLQHMLVAVPERSYWDNCVSEELRSGMLWDECYTATDKEAGESLPPPNHPDYQELEVDADEAN